MEKTINVKDHIGAKVLLNFGSGELSECTISHLSQNEQAVFMVFEGDAHNRWLTIEKFNQLFFDLIKDGFSPTNSADYIFNRCAQNT